MVLRILCIHMGPHDYRCGYGVQHAEEEEEENTGKWRGLMITQQEDGK